MPQDKPLYESVFIVNASLDDAQIDQVIARMQEVVVTNGGEVTSLNRWGRKRLAYTIRKRNNGFYVLLEFSGNGQLISQLERAYQLEENIIRYLTIQLDKKAIKARLSQPPAAVVEAPVIPVPAPAEREPLFESDDEKTS
jgi:small subunit ribosomal protein S6